MLSESFPEPAPPVKRDRTEPLKLLYLGRLSVEKGTDVLLSALAALPPDFRFELSVVGEGPERKKLQEQAVDLGLDNGVRFEGFRTNIGDYLAAADALIMPSRTEGLPMTLVEAAAFGKPVIGSDVGGIPDIVEHEKNGILVPSENVPALGDAILQLEKNLYGYQVRSTELASIIREKYSPRRWADRAVREYARLCGGEKHLDSGSEMQ